MIRASQSATPKEISRAQRVVRGRELRQKQLSKALGYVRRVVADLEREKCDARDLQAAIALLFEAFVKLDETIPYYYCPVCSARGHTATNCNCGGRGWFARNQMNELQAAIHRAKLLDSGDKRTFAKILSDLSKQAGDADDE